MKPPTAFLLAALIGAAPQVAVAATVYLPMGGAGKILVIDADQDKIVRQIDGLKAVHGLAGVTPDGYLVAGSYAETPAGAAAMPAKPEGMSEEAHKAHHAKSAAAAAPGKVVSYLSLVRVADGQVVRRIEVPGAVHHTAVTPDGRYAIATLPNQAGVSIVDLSAFKVVKTLATGTMPNYAVVSRDGTRVYVSNAGDDTVSEIDTESWTLRRNIPTGEAPEHLVLAADGATLYTANVGDGTVTAVILRGPAAMGPAAIRTFAVGGRLHGIDLSEDGRTLFVSGRGENKLVAMDTRSGRMRSVPLGPSPYHLAAVTGTGKLYVSSAEAPKVWVVDQATLEVTGEIGVGGRGHQMVVVSR